MSFVPQDQSERDLAVEGLNSSTFIAAGAGTGKTSTIVKRITHALCHEGSQLKMRNVAAITFTERAAAELKSRVRAELQKISEAGNEKAQVALAGLEEATIGTIHSFAQRILSRFPIEAGLPVAFTIEDETASKQRIREVASAFTESWFGSLSEEDSDALYAVRIGPSVIREFFVELYKKRLLVNEADVLSGRQLDPKLEIDSFMSSLNEWFGARETQIADFTTSLSSRLNDGLAHLNSVHKSLTGFSSAETAPLVAALKTLMTPGNSGGAAAKPFRDEMKSRFAGGLDGVVFIPIENIWRRELPGIWRTIMSEADRRYLSGKLTFDDLMVLVVQLLEKHEDVRRILHNQIKLLVIDEFQDTDQLQWKLATLIATPLDQTGPEPGSLVLVGDAQQSIYSFRGAEIGTYLAVKDSIESGLIDFDPRSLSVNFRSNQKIIDWVNSVFDHPTVELGTSFSKLLVADRNLVQSGHVPGLAVIGGPGADVPPEDEAAFVASAALKAVEQSWPVGVKGKDDSPKDFRPAKFSDVAILIPARTSLENLLEELTVRGVPYRSSDSAIVYDRPVVRGVLDALKAVSGTAEAMDIWFALKSPLFGCDDSELLTYKRLGGRWSLPFGEVDEGLSATRVHKCLSVLADISRKKTSLKPAELMLKIVEETDISSTYDRTPRGRFELECIQMVVRHARRWSESGGMSIFDYLEWVSDQLESDIREALPESQDQSDDSVRISTVHGVKGLEFPIVIIAGMGNGRRVLLPMISLKENRVEFKFGENKTVGYRKVSEALETAERDAEHARILYVASTRARDHLVFSSAAKVNLDGTTNSWSGLIREAVAETVDSGLATRFDQFVAPVANLPQTIEPEFVAESAQWLGQIEKVREKSEARNVLSPSSFKGVQATPKIQEYSVLLDDSAEIPKDYMVDEIEGADVKDLGNAFHGVMQHIVLTRSRELTEQLEKVMAFQLERYSATQYSERLAKMVQKTLASSLLERIFSADNVEPELPMSEINEDGVVVEGFADLVIREGNDLTVIDYKTNLELNESKVSQYRAQLEGYSKILESATGLKVKERLLWHVLPEKIQEISV